MTQPPQDRLDRNHEELQRTTSATLARIDRIWEYLRSRNGGSPPPE